MRRGYRFALVVLVTFGFAGLVEAATLRVDNNTSLSVTVSVDGNYGCNTAAGTYCKIPVSTGTHDVRAVFSDGDEIKDRFQVPDDGVIWTLSE